MEISDSCGKPIIKGSYVVYTGTGTIGKVVDLKTEEEGTWAKVDSTDLWYKSNYLQAIKKIDSKKGPGNSSKVDIREEIKKKKKTVGEDIDMSSELCDGGG